MLRKTSLNLKVLFSSFFLSLPFWWTTNIFQKDLENFLFESEISGNPQIFTAQIAAQSKPLMFKVSRNWRIENLKLKAEGAISILVDSKINQQILFNENIDERLPIASLTKLMTADVVFENYDLSQIVKISHRAVKEEGSTGELKIDEELSVENLLYSLLIESSNDAAVALVEVIGEEAFVGLMNLQAKAIGMENTKFINPTGLDPDDSGGPINYSSARDLVKLMNFIMKTNPKILEISALPEYDLYSPDNTFHHKLINTSGLLSEIDGVVASKTGWTPEAEGCLALAIKAPNNRGTIINVILGSPDRFGEMRKLIKWVKEAHQW